MSKHTPGPWQIDETTSGRYFGVNISTKSAGIRVASAGFSQFSIDEKRANARLMAAAPEMLEALEKVTFAFAVAEEHEEPHDSLCKACALFAVEKAILKASGK